MKNLSILSLLFFMVQGRIEIFASDNKNIKNKEHLNLVPFHLTMNGIRIARGSRFLSHQPNSLDSLDFSEHLLSINSHGTDNRKAIFVDSDSTANLHVINKHLDTRINIKNENKETAKLDLSQILPRQIKLTIFSYLGGDNWAYSAKIVTNEKNEKIRSLCLLNQNTIAIGLINGNIEIWDYINNKLLANLTNKIAGHDFSVVSLLFEPQNNILISGDLDGKVFLWNLTNMGQVCNDIARSGGIKAMCLINLPKKIYIALGLENGLIELVDLDILLFINIGETQEIIKLRDDNTQEITQLIASPDNKYIVSGSADSWIKIWDINSKKLLHSISNLHGRVISLKWIIQELEPRNIKNILIAAFNDKLIAKWNMNFVLNPKKLKDLAFAQKISSMRYLTSLNNYLVVQEDSKIKAFSDDEKIKHNFILDSNVKYNEQLLLSENDDLLIFTNTNEVYFYSNIGKQLLSLFCLLEETRNSSSNNLSISSNSTRSGRSNSDCCVM